ncbi:hypothetical protein [Aquirufa rosea]|uniref:M50 family peptidase n=1 Tax=Aquirufa rosea TaxID=2509241 RepID=A0A4Q1C072_9BACT|nr:hypothetical protein [Aquirufa rosea]RXK49826.1 hypothetical protein ESB04_06540 [Aquirufa rosea]
MNYLLNPDFKLIYSNKSAGDLYFKHTWKDTLILISQVEWEILNHLVTHKDCQLSLEFISKNFEAEENVLQDLIQYSEEIGLLMTEDAFKIYLLQKSANQKAHFSAWKLILSQCFYFLSIPIEFIGKGNLRFYKIAKIPLEKSWMEFIAQKKWVQLAGQLLTLFLLLAGIFPLLFIDGYVQKWLDIDLHSNQLLLPFLISGLLFTTFLHEFAHYLIYLKYGGLVADLGFSLVLGFIPFVHINTNSLHFWENQKHRITVITAGIFFDISLLVGINVILQQISDITWISHWKILQCFIAFRILFNAIPFIPGTDGYFLLTEWMGEPALFHEASRSFQKWKSNFFHRNEIAITGKDYLYLSYIVLSYCFITAYYCLLALWIIIPYLISVFP